MNHTPDSIHESTLLSERIHIIGVGGSATRGLACLLRQKGIVVSGSDRDPEAREVLENHGVLFFQGHDQKNLAKDVTTVIHTRAVDSSNPELVEAKRRSKINIYTYSEYLGKLSSEYSTIAISGTHGKTSTTACLLSVFLAAGRDPSLIAGGEFVQIGSGWRSGNGGEFLVEACEFERAFLDLKPQAAIVTNIDLDHPEVYDDLDSVTDTFRQFVDGFPAGSWVICPPHVKAQLKTDSQLNWRTFGRGDEADVRLIENPAIADPEQSFWQLAGGKEISAKLQVPGAHTRENATAVVALADALGIEPEAIVEGLESFPGVSRRFESCDVLPEIEWIEDYAHHPEEVRATIATAREVYPERRCHVLFQPHQATRLEAFHEEFAKELVAADQVILVPIYSVRENLADFPDDLLDRLVLRISELGGDCCAIGFEEAIAKIPEVVEPGEVVISLGAGNVNEIGKRIGQLIRDQVSQ